jgi:hypothetical protein
MQGQVVRSRATRSACTSDYWVEFLHVGDLSPWTRRLKGSTREALPARGLTRTPQAFKHAYTRLKTEFELYRRSDDHAAEIDRGTIFKEDINSEWIFLVLKGTCDLTNWMTSGKPSIRFISRRTKLRVRTIVELGDGLSHGAGLKVTIASVLTQKMCSTSPSVELFSMRARRTSRLCFPW